MDCCLRSDAGSPLQSIRRPATGAPLVGSCFFRSSTAAFAISTRGRSRLARVSGLVSAWDTRLACLARERKSEVMVRPSQGRHIPAIIVSFEPFSGPNTGKAVLTGVPGTLGSSGVARRTGSRIAQPSARIKLRSARLGARRSSYRTQFPSLIARTALPRDPLLRRQAESPRAVALGAPNLQQSMTCPAKCLLTLPTRKRLGWWS